MKRFLLILSLALIMALMLAGTALANGDPVMIWINGVEVQAGEYWSNGDTGPNPSNDEDDWNAKFEYDDGEGMYILTLDEAEITKADAQSAGIYFDTDEPLTIVLEGENSIKVPVEGEGDGEGDGAESKSGIEVAGDLFIEGDELIIEASAAGIVINGLDADLTINDAEITIDAEKDGIVVNAGDLEIYDAEITIDEAGKNGICVVDGDLSVEDTQLEIVADAFGVLVNGIITFDNCRADVETSGQDCAAILSRYGSGQDEDDDEGIILIDTVILKGGEVVPTYSQNYVSLLELPAAGQLNLYGGVTGILIGWTFSEEDEAYGSYEGDEPFVHDASTHVILGSEEDAAALLNLGIAILGVGKSFPFLDVPANHWAYQYIFDAYKQNLINGKTADLYGPDASLTYAEAIKLAACIRQLAVDGSVTTEPGIGNPWYAPYVSYAELNSIIAKGQFSDKYNQPVSRYDFALIFAKALPEGYYAAIHNYAAIKDVPAGNAYLPYALKLYNAGIITGQDAAGSFNGQTNIKRSEVAAIVIRMVDSGKRL